MSAPFGNPFGSPGIAGTRANPTWSPTPNSEPMGSITGAPVRTRLFSFPLLAGGAPVMIAPGERQNRVLFVTTPDVGFTIFLGDAGVSPLNGYALVAGQETEIPLVGLQEIYAVTNAPVTLSLQVKITPILAAETERRL